MGNYFIAYPLFSFLYAFSTLIFLIHFLHLFHIFTSFPHTSHISFPSLPCLSMLCSSHHCFLLLATFLHVFNSFHSNTDRNLNVNIWHRHIIKTKTVILCDINLKVYRYKNNTHNMPLQENNNEKHQLRYKLNVHNFNIFPEVCVHLNVPFMSTQGNTVRVRK